MNRLFIVIAVLLLAAPAAAQTRQAAAKTRQDSVRIRGFATIGSITFHAKDSFEAVLDSPSGVIFGGGAQVLLPWGVFVEVSASQFRRDGERVFVGPAPAREVFKLGIPAEVTVTPLEITGGWRFRSWQGVTPYAGGGFSSYGYRETSDFALSSENVDERFSGFHIIGGAEYGVRRWMAVGGEVAWSSIPGALDGGVSEVYGEDNLGGTTVRLKISIGR